MDYYEVLPGDLGYRSQDALSYASADKLLPGKIVKIPLRNKLVNGIVITKTSAKPTFKVKEIAESYPDFPPLPSQSLILMNWIHNYYPGPLGAVVQQFLPKTLSTKDIEVESKYSLPKYHSPELTSEQRSVIKKINHSGTYLLHGDTGTGKTRVYIELAQKSLLEGKSSMILTPEISLTSQLEANFSKVFGSQVVVLHSSLTLSERRKVWTKILISNQPLIILGPRSVLFSPIKNLGLIVVDEAHEGAYKQEQSPHYHATRVASKLSELHGATLVIGSATPSVEDYFLAEQKNIPILRMKELAVANKKTNSKTTIVDLKDKDQTSKYSFISTVLISAVEAALIKKEQVLIFLNRRGTARVVFCENCGWKSICPRCDVPLVYHGDSHTMQCHTCGYKDSPPTSCPTCHQDKIVFKSIGTKAVADSMKSLFPYAKIQRFDNDNLKAERFEKHYEAIKSGEVDILVGTQTLAKGLDLPRLSVVGIIMAETSLFLPDYTAGEHMLQILTQVMGRVDRGHRDSQVIVQSFDPTNSVLNAVLKKDWKKFYETELAERKTYGFPPFYYILKLTCRRATQKSAIEASNKLAAELKNSSLKIKIYDPAPSFHERIGGKYQWQLIVKAKNRTELLELTKNLPSGWTYDIDPSNLL